MPKSQLRVLDKHKEKKQEKKKKVTVTSTSAPIAVSILAQTDISAIRTEQFNGVEHTVIPLIALVEGVVTPSNSEGPELALASEFGKVPAGWNGRPIVLDHPELNGEKVSANIPEVLEAESFGMMFNTTINDGKLKSEAWLNTARVEELGGDVAATVAVILSGDQTVELSTGLFMTLEASQGEFDGETFDGIWRNVVPDHLAILPIGMTGASSVEAGAGIPRLNSSRRTYVTASANVNTDISKQSIFKRLLEAGKGLISFRNQQELSDRDVREALEAAVEGELSSEELQNTWVWIIAVFNATFVYESGQTLLQRSYTITDDGIVSLADDSVEVRPVTEFVPIITNSLENDTMEKDEKIAALIANKATKFSDDDKKWLGTLDEATLDKLVPEEIAVNDSDADSEGSNETSGGNVDSQEETSETPETPETFISKAPEEMQEVLNSGLSMHRERKDKLVTGLRANSRCTFSEDSLRAKSLDELESLATLANLPDYSGINTLAAQDDVTTNSAPPLPIAFPVKQAS